MSTETLTEWLLRQVADDEKVAREANHRTDDKPMPYYVVDDDWRYEVVGTNTARVLAECEAKRGAIEAAWDDQVRIEGECGSGQSREQMSAKGDNPPVVKWLALPYADRPGYLAEWRP